MPNIPVPNYRGENTLDSVPALDKSISRVQASPDAYGAQVGKALSGLGDAFGQGTDALYKADQQKTERDRQEKIANAVAQVQPELTAAAMEAQRTAPPDASGVVKSTIDATNELRDKKAAEAFPGDVRGAQEFKTRTASQVGAHANQAVQFQFQREAEFAKAEADKSLNALGNNLRANPTTYDAAVEQGNAVIDASKAVPNFAKAAYKDQWAQNAANTRFEGMIVAAKSADDLQRIQNELTAKGSSESLRRARGESDADFAQRQAEYEKANPSSANDWQKRLSQNDYEKLINHLESGKKVFQTKADTDARTALDTLEARGDTAIAPDELKATSDLVAQSKNTMTAIRMSRLMRNQQLLTENGLPPSELQARANAAKGGPGMSYPNLPPELSRSINAATGVFPGVSAAYLGGMIMREYGGNIPRQGSRGDVKFSPQPAREDVDLRNVAAPVRDALTVAGQVYGEPFVITSGYRSQEKQDAIKAGNPGPSVATHSAHTDHGAVDISTAGKSQAEQAKMVDALVQAGFTGIGQYGSHIHADVRQNVPSSFQNSGDNPAWGGWTTLSPEVSGVLTKRGFKGGASAADINRDGPASAIMASGAPAAVDYTIQNPASTATGVAQFTKRTFLDVTDPAVNAGVVANVKTLTGVDMSKMTPEQRLELRKNPSVSVAVAAAFAAQNKATLEDTLRRPVTDPEVYMAHFLGAGGALTLIRNNVANGDKPAAEIMPDAAASNKNVFFDKAGKSYTVSQVYNNITREFGTMPSQVAFGDAEFWQRRHDNAVKSLRDNPVGYAREDGGKVSVVPLGQNGWEARGASFNAIGKYYQVANEDNKPFDQSTEVPTLQKQLKDGTAEDVYALLQNMAKMDNAGRGSLNAGLKQLGAENSAYSVAAGLSQNDQSTATDIIRGEKRMTADPQTKTLLGTEHDAVDQFNKTIGSALYGVSPEARDAIRKAANAHYVETAANSGLDKFDKNLYAQSVQAVIGGRETPRVGNVNGATTLLPKGVDETSMQTAIARMSDADLLANSVDKNGIPIPYQPTYTDGKSVPAADVRNQGKFRNVGNDTFQIQMGDGKWLVIPQRTGGGFAPYLMRLDKTAVDTLKARPAPNTFEMPVADPQLELRLPYAVDRGLGGGSDLLNKITR